MIAPLSLAIWTPILFSIILIGLGGLLPKKLGPNLALLGGFVSFIITIPVLIEFNYISPLFQFQEFHHWILPYRINYHLGVDGFSVPLILLTSFMTMIVIFLTQETNIKNLNYYHGAFLMMSGLMIGVFSSLDVILYYIFWEAMLIPMFLIIGVWGGPNRIYATIKFFLYTVLGSLLMLVAFIYLFFEAGSFSLIDYYHLPLSLPIQIFLFVAFFMAFAVKIPMWPVHTWLPDAHVEAPTGGSVILAAIMLKLGGYSFLRFALPITPDAVSFLQPALIVISLIAIVYIAIIAMAQKDMKKLIAYSSISHMGFVTLGIFLLTPMSVEGAYVQMISHGFISAALFISIGILYDQTHTREIQNYGGVINKMPLFSALVVFFAMANSGLPGTSGFVGEFMVIMAAAQENFWIALTAAMTLLLGAAYSLWMVKRVFYGEAKSKVVLKLKEINFKQTLVLVSLALLILILGLFPFLITDITNTTAENFIQFMNRSKFPIL